jgi:Ca-activated chloride channel family protein
MWTLAWWWLILLLPLPWLVRRLVPAEPFDRDAALRVPEAQDFLRLGAGATDRRLDWRLPALWTLWALVLFAAARPQFVGDPLALPASGRDLLMAVDLSGSMEEQDFQLGGQWVNRLIATQAVARDFIARRVGDRVGLILFGRQAYLQVPLTPDRSTVQALLDEAVIGLAGKETAIGDAIGLAIKTLDDAGIEQGRRVLILLTDGANTAGTIDPLKAAALAAERHMVIYTIGIGADALMVRSLFGIRQINPSADLDEQSLSRIAELTGGRYFRARDTEEFGRIYAELNRLEPTPAEEAGFRPVRELFHWPLGLALLLTGAWAASAIARSRAMVSRA